MLREWLNQLNPYYSFRQRLGLAIALTILSFSLLLSLIVGYVSQSQIRIDSGKFMEQLAYQMVHELDQRMSVYFEEIQILTTLPIFQDIKYPHFPKRIILEKLKLAYEDFAWIGLTDAQGTVIASTGGILEKENVSQRPWFKASQKQSSIQDVHEAKLLSSYLPNPKHKGEPYKFIDVAAPVFNIDNNFVGVLGAHLYLELVSKLQDAIFKPLHNYRHLEILILSAEGKVLLASHENSQFLFDQTDFHFPAKLNTLPSFRAAQKHNRGFILEEDNDHYLTGYAKTEGYGNCPGLGWIVLVRQSTSEAFAAARSLEYTILQYAVILGIISSLLSWEISGRIIKPMMMIAATADRIRQGDTTAKIPVFFGKDEVSKFSLAIADLFTTLEQQKQLLVKFNSELEQLIQIRTEKLSSLNQQLLKEVNERKQAEIALQESNKELHRLTITDGLTGIANRRHFDQYLQKAWRILAREQLPLSLILADVDFFKKYNDLYGHQAGDICLQKVAQTLSQNLSRPGDLAARYGGEEFTIILPNTDIVGANHVAKILCQAIQNLQIPHAGSEISQYVSVSIGLVTLIPRLETHPRYAVKQADLMLYQAKTQGRNQTVSQVLS